MFRTVSERLTDSLVEAKVIASEERELYRYGFQQGLTMLLNLLTAVIIGMICGMLWQSVVFYVAYIPLRSYAGGYHAKTPTGCYIFSVVLMFAILSAMRLAPPSSLMCGIMLLCASACILLGAPVEDSNKPLDAAEQKVYGRRARVVTVFELALAVLSLLLQWRSLAVCLTATLVVASALLLLGALKNRLTKHRSN